MRQYWILVKVIMMNAFRLDRMKKKLFIGTVCVFGFLGIFFGIMTVSFSIFMGVLFAKAQLHAEFIALLFIAAQVVVLLFGTAFMVGVMFFNKDTEFVLSLPVKPAQLFFAKLTYVYLSELVITLFFVLLGGVTFGIVTGLSWSFYIALLLATLILPLLPLFIASILALPIMYVVSFFKNKGALAGIAMVILFTGFMVLYLSAFSGLAESEDTGDIIQLTAAAILTIKRVMGFILPDIALARLILGQGIWVNLGITVLCYGTLGALAYLIATKIYKRSMSMQLEQSQSVRMGKVEFKRSTAIISIMKKDIKEIIRHPYLSFYCLFQLIFSPIMLFFMSSTMGGAMSFGNSEVVVKSLSMIEVLIGFFIVGLMGTSMNYVALSTITREGENFIIMKSLPVSYHDQIQAKVWIASVISIVSVCLSSMVMFFIMKIEIWQLLLFLVTMIIYSDGFVHFLCGLDIKRPKLHYESISQVLKNSTSSLIGMGVSCAIMLGFCGLYLAAFGLTFVFPAVYCYIFFWIFAMSIAVIINMVFRKNLYRNIEYKVMSIED